MHNNKALALETTTPYDAELSLAVYSTSSADFTTTDGAIDIVRGNIVCEVEEEEDTVVYKINRVFSDGQVNYTASVTSLVDGNANNVTNYTTTSTQIILPALAVGDEYDLILDASPDPSTYGGQPKPVRRGSTTLTASTSGAGG